LKFTGPRKKRSTLNGLRKKTFFVSVWGNMPNVYVAHYGPNLLKRSDPTA